ncbi:MAG TPA: hypothetical protein VJ907_05645 [Halanaerobiales bacterium]|nr:hypothetical protein [Halanaerobiales bacterium]
MAKDIKVKKAVNWFENNRERYKKLANKVENIIKEMLIEKDIYYHSIASRAKKVDSFTRKAKRDKYTEPSKEITDLAGIRIVTLFEKDVHEISDLIKNVFIIDYENSEDKSDLLDADKMGYKSVHYIANLTQELVNNKDYKIFKDLQFEIQIRSILQHAWAEIEHDRNYKLKGNLPKHLQRRFYALSGMLEMADREFNLLAEEVDEYKQKVKELTRNGEIDIEITATSLQKYLLNEFRAEVNKGIIEPTFKNKSQEITNELSNYGIWDLVNLDSIVPNDIHAVITDKLSERESLNFNYLLKLIMTVNDYHKYFEKVWNNKSDFINQVTIKIIKEYNIPIEKLAKEYNISI